MTLIDFIDAKIPAEYKLSITTIPKYEYVLYYNARMNWNIQTVLPLPTVSAKKNKRNPHCRHFLPILFLKGQPYRGQARKVIRNFYLLSPNAFVSIVCEIEIAIFGIVCLSFLHNILQISVVKYALAFVSDKKKGDKFELD